MQTTRLNQFTPSHDDVASFGWFDRLDWRAELSGTGGADPELPIPASTLNLALVEMMAIAPYCLPIVKTGCEIAARDVSVFLLCCLANATALILATRQSETLGLFSAALMGLKAPAAVITPTGIWTRRAHKASRARR